MKNNIVIEVKNLSKKYTIRKNKDDNPTLRDAIIKSLRSLIKRERSEKFWALKNISFSIKKGDVVGIIGKNGAGKSTILKILSRIVTPTEGEVQLRGRVASLLEIGTGFQPELTGRENIYLNGSILGMKKIEIKKKFNDIVKFSGVDKFLDTPVKFYSSGMHVRLAFSVAAHLESEILLIDEVLAVGDAEFQKKCLGKMNSLAKSGRTIIFVSHDIPAIQRICKKAIYIKDGMMVKQGNVNDITTKYLLEKKTQLTSVIFKNDNSLAAQITKIDFKGAKSFEYNKPITFTVNIRNNINCANIYLSISILDKFDIPILFWRDFELDYSQKVMNNIGAYQYIFTIPPNTFVPGSYSIKAKISDFNHRTIIDEAKQTLGLEIIDLTTIGNRLIFKWKSVVSIKPTMQINKIKNG